MAAPGEVLGGKYVLRELLGEGGMGAVFLADQPALARTVVVKVLHSRFADDRAVARRFREEAVAACRVRHPGAVVIIDCAIHSDGTPFIVMEHVHGRPLGRLAAEEILPVQRAVDLVLQILSVLDAAHASGVVHADVKSDNFLVEDIGGTDHVTMIDYGLARLDGNATQYLDEAGDAIVSGTPEYMAPEVILGAVPTYAADLYGAGVILYELLTGATPFAGGSASDVMSRQIEDPVVPPSLRQLDRELPAGLDEIVLRALAKRPDARFADAAAFARALQALAYTRGATREIPVRRPEPANVDAPTNVGVPLSPRRIARGSDCAFKSDGEQLRAVRVQIANALTRGDIDQIASGYVALANVLIAREELAAAARELEEGIDLLTAGSGPDAPEAPASVEQLVLALAALYEETGEPQLARRTAHSADSHLTLHDLHG